MLSQVAEKTSQPWEERRGSRLEFVWYSICQCVKLVVGFEKQQRKGLHPFLRTSQQLAPICCNRSTTNLFIITVLSRILDFFLFLPELMDLFVASRDQSAADQPNNLAEGHIPMYPLLNHLEIVRLQKRLRY
jgi:hypothetical protein